MTADVQRNPTVCLCGGRPGPHGYGEPGCLDAADVQRELAGVIDRHAVRGTTVPDLAAALLPTVQRLIADAEKRAAAAALPTLDRLIRGYADEARYEYDAGRTAALDLLVELRDLRTALDPAGAASGETT